VATTTTAPVEKKTAASASASVVSGVITWILVTYVPAFHSGLPGPLATFLPYIVTTVCGALAAYFAPHTPREDEIVKSATDLLKQAGVTLP